MGKRENGRDQDRGGKGRKEKGKKGRKGRVETNLTAKVDVFRRVRM
jgi:hypothetical protein